MIFSERKLPNEYTFSPALRQFPYDLYYVFGFFAPSGRRVGGGIQGRRNSYAESLLLKQMNLLNITHSRIRDALIARRCVINNFHMHRAHGGLPGSAILGGREMLSFVLKKYYFWN